jgi:hypothetical protein
MCFSSSQTRRLTTDGPPFVKSLLHLRCLPTMSLLVATRPNRKRSGYTTRVIKEQNLSVFQLALGQAFELQSAQK